MELFVGNSVALSNGDFKGIAFDSNSDADISSYGLGLGVTKKVLKEIKSKMTPTTKPQQNKTKQNKPAFNKPKKSNDQLTEDKLNMLKNKFNS